MPTLVRLTVLQPARTSMIVVIDDPCEADLSHGQPEHHEIRECRLSRREAYLSYGQQGRP